MARKLRLEYPGAIYHVMNRGDHREAIFFDDPDRSRFLDTLGDACRKTGWQIHAYCLMGNHFYLVVETPQPNLVAGMKWLLATYTSRFNRRHKLFGRPVSSCAFRSLAVYKSSSGALCSGPMRRGTLFDILKTKVSGRKTAGLGGPATPVLCSENDGRGQRSLPRDFPPASVLPVKL